MLDDGSSLKPLLVATAVVTVGLLLFVAWALAKRREPWARALPPAAPPVDDAPVSPGASPP